MAGRRNVVGRSTTESRLVGAWTMTAPVIAASLWRPTDRVGLHETLRVERVKWRGSDLAADRRSVRSMARGPGAASLTSWRPGTLLTTPQTVRPDWEPGSDGGQGQNRTADTTFFSCVFGGENLRGRVGVPAIVEGDVVE